MNGMKRLDRRQFLGVTGTLAAAAALPACGANDVSQLFSADERTALNALADYLIPADKSPSASALGAAQYIEKLLTSFSSGTAPIFAGGPYSGRQPFGDGTGQPSLQLPPDSFDQFVALDRVNVFTWKVKIFGGGSVPNGNLNEPVIGAQPGLIATLKGGFQAALSRSKVPLNTLTATELAPIYNATPADFQSAFQELVMEACFSDPVYGGNRNFAGWQMCNFEGDSQPLGYSIYDTDSGGYLERPDHPNSTPNPGRDPDPMDAQTHALLVEVFAFLGGTVFY